MEGLRRVLKLPAVTFIAVGMTIGGGIFVFTGIVLKITGPALPVAFSLAVIPVFLSMLPLAMLGSALPVTGGNYIYPSRMVSPRLAFTGVWVYALATFFGQIPLYSIACARYIQVIVPNVSETVFAAGLITFFCIINVIGIKPAARLQALMVLILLSALLFFSLKGLAEPNLERFDSIFQMGTGSLLLGIALLTFTYLGSNGIIELGQEIKDPAKVIPRAYFIAFPLVTIIYLLVALAVVNSVPWQSMTDVREPLIEIGKASMSPASLIYFVMGGAVLALTTTLNGLLIMATKSLMAISSDGLLPKGLGRINKRFGTAHGLFLAIWAISMIGVFSGIALETFACYAAMGGIIIFIPVLIASIVFPNKYPERYQNAPFRLKGIWRFLCPVTGILMGVFFCIVILVDLKEPAKVIPFFIFILTGVLFYESRRRYLLKKGIDVEKAIKNDDWISKHDT